MKILNVYHGTTLGNSTHDASVSESSLWFCTDSSLVASQSSVDCKVVLYNEDTEEFVENKNSSGRISRLFEYTYFDVHSVNINWKNPKIYVSEKIDTTEYQEELDKLIKEYSSLITNSSFEENLCKRNELYLRLTEVESLMEELKKKISIRDSYEMFVYDRNKYCKSININCGNPLLDTKELTKKYIDYLKSEGYDGVWLKSTVQKDMKRNEPIDIFIAENSLIEIISCGSVSDYLSEDELTSIKEIKKQGTLLLSLLNNGYR